MAFARVLIVLVILGLLVTGYAFLGKDLFLTPVSPVVTAASPLVEEHPLETETSPPKKENSMSTAEPIKKVGPSSPSGSVIANERTVHFSKSSDLQNFLNEAKGRGLTILGVIPKLNAVRVGGSSEITLDQALDGVKGGEVGFNFGVMVPNDPARSNAAAKSQTPLVPFDQNWMKALGVNTLDPNWGSGVKVAVVDTGIEPNVTFAGGKISTIDLIPKETLTNTTSSSHGTAVGSLIAGRSSQLPGLAQGSTLLSVRVLDSNGEGDTFTVAQGVIRAVDEGSQVINLSLGSPGDSSVLRDAISYALAHQVAVVAAAGNEGTGNVDYPAAYPGVLAVGAIDGTMHPANFSNTGPELGVMGPGVGLPAAWGVNQAISFSGTSASTATVSGAVAAILSGEHNLSALQVVAVIERYCDDMGIPGRDSDSGYGTVDLGRVLERNTPNVNDGVVASQFILGPVLPGQPVSVGITVQNRGTVPIWSGTLATQSVSTSSYLPILNLEPGQSVMQVIKIYQTQLVNGEAIVSSQLTLNGLIDRNLANNLMQSRLRVVPTPSQ